MGIINNGAIIHGALLDYENFYTAITGPGGTGKTFAAILHCLKDSRPFCGDDIFFMKDNIAYPIIRPLCIYPDHIKTLFNPHSIKHQIKLEINIF